MNERRRARRTLAALAAPLIMASALVGLAPAGASDSACVTWNSGQPPNPGTASNVLSGVAVLSPCNAWAVGTATSGTVSKTLIEHWNGTTWNHIPSPSPGTSQSFLSAVTATSAASTWAVGTYVDGTSARSLILHWTGKAWKQAKTPNPGTVGGNLTGVTALSARDAWAVGDSDRGGPILTLVLHWNGTTWKHVRSPNAPGSTERPFAADPLNFLSAVTAISPANVWAVGVISDSDDNSSLIEHWNGHAWKNIGNPAPDRNNGLTAIAAISASSIWAVGWFSDDPDGAQQPLTEHWNGHAWKFVASPNPGGSTDITTNFLNGVTAVSARNVWAVGARSKGTPEQTLILHWNGTSWKQVASPDPGGPGTDNVLSAVAAASATDVWAVGNDGPATLAIHGS